MYLVNAFTRLLIVVLCSNIWMNFADNWITLIILQYLKKNSFCNVENLVSHCVLYIYMYSSLDESIYIWLHWKFRIFISLINQRISRAYRLIFRNIWFHFSLEFFEKLPFPRSVRSRSSPSRPFRFHSEFVWLLTLFNLFALFILVQTLGVFQQATQSSHRGRSVRARLHLGRKAEQQKPIRTRAGSDNLYFLLF